MSSASHLQRKRDELQKQYDLLSEKIHRLRTDHAIETDSAIRFKLEKQVEQAEVERQSIEHQLVEAIDQQSTQVLSSRNKILFLPGCRYCLAILISVFIIVLITTFVLFWLLTYIGIIQVAGVRIIAESANFKPAPEVMILSIKDGERISEITNPVHGTFRSVPEYKEIWLVASHGTMCYPMDGPAIKEPTGVWRHSPLQFPADGYFHLSTVVADEKSAALLRVAVGKSTGLPCLPDGAEYIDTISIEILN